MKSLGSAFFYLLIPFFFFSIQPSLSVHVCKPESCSENEPPIRFPFWLKGKHEERCGYPGFQLSCDNQSQTIIRLPQSGDFVVSLINYTAQAIHITDPELCLAKRILDFSVTGTPFRPAPGKKYTYFNCSSRWNGYREIGVPLYCVTDYYLVLVTENHSPKDLPSSCRLIPNVSVPLKLPYARYYSGIVSPAALGLTWSKPGCRDCEIKNMYCGFNTDTGLEIGCSSPPRRGLPRSAKYGLIIGVGIPGLMCLIGFVCYACGKVREFGQRRSLDADLSTPEMNPTPSVRVTGLDAPTIESYPKTVIGESFCLSKLSDGTCPICLSEYQPKDTLRSIPECNHYFHASCVDEWLKLNGTCPVCRSSPESTSVTPCSSMSSAFSTSSA